MNHKRGGTALAAGGAEGAGEAAEAWQALACRRLDRASACRAPRPLWAYDFVFDRTADGRKLRLLTIVDEYTRECLAVDVARRLNSQDVLARRAGRIARLPRQSVKLPVRCVGVNWCGEMAEEKAISQSSEAKRRLRLQQLSLWINLASAPRSGGRSLRGILLIYCPYVDQDIPDAQASREHIIPLSLGGTDCLKNPLTLPLTRRLEVSWTEPSPTSSYLP